MVEGRSQPRLAQKPLAKLSVLRDLWRQHLQRDVAFQSGVVGEEDDAHAASAQHALDAVPRQLRADPILGQKRHGSSVRPGSVSR
jgi:hypothetical protein